MSDTPTVQVISDSRHRLETELRHVMLELDDLVEPMRRETTRNRHGHGIHSGWMAVCGALVMLSILAVGSLFQALDSGSWLKVVILLPLGMVAIYQVTRLWPRAAPEMHRLSRERRALIVRKKQLETVLAGQATDSRGMPIVLDGAPASKVRRPTDFAQVLWHSGGRLLGPSPADALRDLPTGTPSVRLAFHRYLGWGLPIMLLVVLAITALTMAAI